MSKARFADRSKVVIAAYTGVEVTPNPAEASTTTTHGSTTPSTLVAEPTGGEFQGESSEPAEQSTNNGALSFILVAMIVVAAAAGA